LRRILWTIIAIELGIMLGAWTADVLAQDKPVHRVTLHGKLFTAPDVECGFFLDPLGESEGIQLLQVQDGNYLCDYLKGSDARAFTIVMGPE
jgi:hypothetical protein